MLAKAPNAADLVLAVSIFGLVLAVWFGIVLLWLHRRAAQARKIEQRLGMAAGEGQSTRILRLWREGREETTVVQGGARWRSLPARLAQLCREAGWEIPLRTLLLGGLGVASAVVLFVFAITGNLLMGCGLATLVGIGFWIYLKQRIARRSALFETQFVDAMQIAVRSLRAGHPLVVAFRLISQEIAPPIGTLFGQVCQEQALGMSLEDAIQSVSDRSNHPDVKLFATSVIIQLRSGGNLADMMDRLAGVIRERMRLTRRVRVLLAQVQLSKRILLALPFVLFILLNIVKPGYLMPLYTTSTGQMFLAAAVVCLLLGAWTMNRLAVVRY